MKNYYVILFGSLPWCCFGRVDKDVVEDEDDADEDDEEDDDDEDEDKDEDEEEEEDEDDGCLFLFLLFLCWAIACTSLTTSTNWWFGSFGSLVLSMVLMTARPTLPSAPAGIACTGS